MIKLKLVVVEIIKTFRQNLLHNGSVVDEKGRACRRTDGRINLMDP